MRLNAPLAKQGQVTPPLDPDRAVGAYLPTQIPSRTVRQIYLTKPRGGEQRHPKSRTKLYSLVSRQWT
jgi:hypothetical protein